MPNPKRIVLTRFSRWLGCLLVLAVSGCQMMSGHASNNLGTAYFREGNYAAAQRSFQQAVAEMPENPDFRYNLAATMQRQGNVAGAEQIYRQALNIAPSHQPSYHGLAQMMNGQGRQAEASSLLNTWVATQPYTPASHIEMAWLQQQQGNTDAAAQSLQTALKLQPNHPTALAHLGKIYQDSGQPETAVAYFERSLQANWRQPEVQNRLAALKPKMQPGNRTQVAFGGPRSGGFLPRNPMQTAWQPPQNRMAGLPTATPRTFATVPPGSPMIPPQSQMVGLPTPVPRTFAAAPQGPPLAPQVQTAWMPPQTTASQFLMPTGQPTPVQQGQPTPVAFPQPTNTPVTPTPTFATAPPNADPAHVPQVTAELPVVRPY